MKVFNIDGKKVSIRKNKDNKKGSCANCCFLGRDRDKYICTNTTACEADNDHYYINIKSILKKL